MGMGPRNELLKRAMERQSRGADEALSAILVDASVDGDADAGWSDPGLVRWKDEWEAEMRLRRFLQRFPV
jgi:hypothetical protein